jgi:uncharacterized SAM-binding protein YcdF (DUF218 family)
MTDELNAIAHYLARRDIKELSVLEIGNPVDLLVLCGSSLLHSVELAAKVMKDGLAKRLLVSGGIGHSTQYLRDVVESHPDYHMVATEGRAEADILHDILVGYLGVEAELVTVENQSTNCGANAEESKKLLDAEGTHINTLLFIQDPTMQRRTHASFERFFPDTKIISFAAMIPFAYEKRPRHFSVEGEGNVWPFDRFLSLIVGEIVRLHDTEEGYGPKGKNFIDYVEVPAEVLEAYGAVSEYFKLTNR